MTLIEDDNFVPGGEFEVSCNNCHFFEPRTKFCRRFPPQTINSGKREDDYTGYVTTYAKSVFPIIKCPLSDYCGEFRQKFDK